ncbi:MAG: hypothetical protein IJL03_01735 [Lachnospiraceae bacterium]|nr:hypothetical protein [Lachnospiraceae bacterium]
MEKKKNRGSAVVAVIVVLALIGLGVGLFFFFRGRKYDPGKLENGTYTNKWARIQFTAPEGFSSKTQTQDGEKYYAFTKGSEIVMIGTTDQDTDVDGGLDELKQILLGANAYSSSLGIKMDIKDPTTSMIAGEKFKCVQISMGASGTYIYVNLYARKVHGNGVIFIAVASSSPSGVDSLLYRFKRY